MASRPQTLAEIAEQIDNFTDFGYAFRDWFHELKKWEKPEQVLISVKDEPRSLAPIFGEGYIADVWLGAHAEYICEQFNQPSPPWTLKPERFLPANKSYFIGPHTLQEAKNRALNNTPYAFKRRNLFYPDVYLPLNPNLILPKHA